MLRSAPRPRSRRSSSLRSIPLRAGLRPQAVRPSSRTATNYLIDLKRAVIVDVEPTDAVRQAEVTAAKTMIDPNHRDFGL